MEHARLRERFGFRFDPWYRAAAAPFGVSPGSAHVDVEDAPDGERRLVARYGPWQLTTAVGNVLGTTPTGPFSAWKTIGPAHVSLVDGGLTFASNPDRGLCIRFHTSVPGIVPSNIVRHPGLTVTVEDVDGLARALSV